MTAENRFGVDRDGFVVRLTLDRPEKRNAMDPDFFRELADLFDRFDADDGVRTVVMGAAGPSFSAGTDLGAVAAMLGSGTAGDRERLVEQIRVLQEAIGAVERCRKPVVAAVHGHCLGGGLDLICACDIRLADASAIFGVRETRLGIIADLGTLQRLPLIIGSGRCAELVYTGRDFTAQEALQMGLVTQVCEDHEGLDAAAAILAGRIAANPPLAVQGAKAVLRHSRDHGPAAGLALAARCNAVALYSADVREAFAALMEKRTPEFKGK
jgi:enoyl-CoA hydratase/carnithine racemase